MSTSKTCPRCGKTSSSIALGCDCGHVFAEEARGDLQPLSIRELSEQRQSLPPSEEPSGDSQPSGWAIASIVLSCIGYGEILIARAGCCSGMESLGSGLLAAMVVFGSVLLGFIAACIAAVRGERRRPVLVAFGLSAGPFLIYMILTGGAHP
jgi:hypothetical protein